MLSHRHEGIGADRSIVVAGPERTRSFRCYTADGVQQEMTAEDYRVLSRSHEDLELHVTEYFVGQLRQADAVSVSVAG